VGSVELRQLRYVVTLAEELHFGRAAAREHVTQSVLSQQIQRLERELGTPLFDRSRHHVRLTDAGQVFLDGARRQLADLGELVSRTHRAGNGERVTLRIGCVGFAQWWPAVRRLFERYGAAHGEVTVEMVYQPVPQLVQLLAARDLDAALVTAMPETPAMASELVAEEPMELAVAADHRLAGYPDVRFGDLAGETLVVWPREVHPAAYDETVRVFQRHGVAVTLREVTQIHQAWLGAVAAGEGIALVAAPNRLGYEGVVRRPFHGFAPTVELRLLTHTGEDRPAARALVRTARLVHAELSRDAGRPGEG
jgi:DNA-binding transcriptional LysR family regulator